MEQLFFTRTQIAAADLKLIESFDPRSRLLAVLWITLCVSVIKSPLILSVLFSWGCLTCIFNRMTFRVLIKRLLAMDAFILVILFTLPFTVAPESPQDVAWRVAFWGMDLTASQSGILAAFVIFLKANAIMLALQGLVGTMDISEFGKGMGMLGLPDKLIVLMVFTLRYLALIHRQFRDMRLAMRARAFRLTTSWHSWRTLGYLIGMMLVRSLERAERVHAAMRCRGFDGRLLLHQDLVFKPRDFGFLVCHALLPAILVYMDFFDFTL